MGTKHTPTPWSVAEWEVRDSDGAVDAGGWQVVGADGYGIDTCIGEGDGEQAEANLHFVVRACNAHDQLVSALAACLKRLVADCADKSCVEIMEARAALTAAGVA